VPEARAFAQDAWLYVSIVTAGSMGWPGRRRVPPTNDYRDARPARPWLCPDRSLARTGCRCPQRSRPVGLRRATMSRVPRPPWASTIQVRRSPRLALHLRPRARSAGRSGIPTSTQRRARRRRRPRRVLPDLRTVRHTCRGLRLHLHVHEGRPPRPHDLPDRLRPGGWRPPRPRPARWRGRGRIGTHRRRHRHVRRRVRNLHLRERPGGSESNGVPKDDTITLLP